VSTVEKITTMRLMPSCALLPSVAYRNRTSIAPMTAVQGSAPSWISDGSTASTDRTDRTDVNVSAIDSVVAVKGFGTPAGIRSWSPPV